MFDLVNVLIIFDKEIRDVHRHRWFLLLSFMFAGISFALSIFGLAGTGALGISGFGRTTASLLHLTLLIVPLMGLLLGSLAVSSERENGTLITMMAQPVSRSEIFFGKFLGQLLALSSAVLIGFGLSGLVIGISSGINHLTDYLFLVGFTLMLGFIFLAVGFLISIFCKRNATAIGIALFVWFLFLILSDVGMMASAVMLKLSSAQMFWIILLNPVQVFKMSVIGLFHADPDVLGPVGLYAVQLFGKHYSLILPLVLGAWACLTCFTSFLFFTGKDLTR